MPASPVVCRCTQFRWKRSVDPSGSLSKTVSGYREALLAGYNMDAVILKMARIVFTTDGLGGSPLILNKGHWLTTTKLPTQPACINVSVMCITVICNYGGQTWGKTVAPHELKREEYDRVWVVVQATDKACAARGASQRQVAGCQPARPLITLASRGTPHSQT
jgi:hypothetical protein